MQISNEGILVILFVGLVAGWLAGKIVHGTGFGIIGDILVGIAGALGRMVDTLGKRPAQRLHFNRLMGAPLNSIDPIAGGTENTVRVKVYPA